MSFNYIEGYLCKEIDTKNLLRRTKRHLRYFRIIYSTGKLNIKEDKNRKEMRSFPLHQLARVKLIKLPDYISSADLLELDKKTMLNID